MKKSTENSIKYERKNLQLTLLIVFKSVKLIFHLTSKLKL